MAKFWVSERVMAPWTGKRSRAQLGRKSKDQTFRQSEHILNNLSDVQRVGNVYEKQARMSHSLLSPDQSPCFWVKAEYQHLEVLLLTRGIYYYDAETLLMSSVASWPCLAQRTLSRLICGIKVVSKLAKKSQRWSICCSSRKLWNTWWTSWEIR